MRNVWLVVRPGLGTALLPALHDVLGIAGHQVREIEDPAPRPDVSEGAGVGVFVGDHDDPDLQDFPAAWRLAGQPSIVVQQQHPDVGIGPLDVPGTVACSLCLERRLVQRGRRAAPRPRRSEPGLPIDGFPPALTRLCALLVARRLRALESPHALENEVTIVNGHDLTAKRLPVVPVDRCEACGPAQIAQSRVTTGTVFAELDAVLR